MHSTRIFGLVTLLAFIAACGQQGPAQSSAPGAQETAASAQETIDPAITAAVADAGRLAADLEEDAQRHPVEVLHFLGVKPGMHVLDFGGGPGYYTSLLSRVVGADGGVIIYNDDLYTKFYGERLQARLAEDPLPNVQALVSPVNELTLEPGQLDAALFVMAYHDLYHTPAAGTDATDVPGVVAKVFAALKSGGVVIVQDHVATAGADVADSANSTHRIDPEAVRRVFSAAGFVEDGQSPLFANPEDDHTKSVFDASVRGNTDRFMLRFRKS